MKLLSLMWVIACVVGCAVPLSTMSQTLGENDPPSAKDESSLFKGELPWKERVIYFAVIDRFVNGDTSRDQAHGRSECNKSGDIHAYQGGDLSGLTSKVEYLKDLGIDTVWITPLYKGVEQKEGRNCGFPGYWADFSVPYKFELDPRFGSKEDFDTLIENLHARKMKIILDMVVNHAGYAAKITETHPHWFSDPQSCSQLGNPEVYCPLAGLPDFRQENQEVADYLVDLHKVWLERFPIDGIRMDTVKHVAPWYFARWNGEMKRIRPDLYMLGEILDEHSYDLFGRYLDAGFDGLFNFPLRSKMISVFALGNSVDEIAEHVLQTRKTFGSEKSDLFVNLLDNHDVPRFLEYMPEGISDRDVLMRYKLAVSALLTLPGIPQIYYGNEIGMYGGKDPYNRRFMPGWAFEDGERTGKKEGFVNQPDEVFQHMKKLLRIRRESASLRRGNYYEIWRQNGVHQANVWAYLRKDPFSDDVSVVVINNGRLAPNQPIKMNVRGKIENGTLLTNLLSNSEGSQILVQNGHITVNPGGRSTLLLRPETSPSEERR